jgi:hypothetical protein
MKPEDGRTAQLNKKYDPQLHILRSIAGSIEDMRQRQEAQSARFNLYAALEQGDVKAAINWLDALETAFSLATIPNMLARQKARDAMTFIREGLQ